MSIRALASSMMGLALALGLAAAALAQAPPSAPRDDSVDHAFGRTLPDPYRWMEGQDNARFAEWLKAQAAAGRSWLDASPALASSSDRTRPLGFMPRGTSSVSGTMVPSALRAAVVITWTAES